MFVNSIFIEQNENICRFLRLNAREIKKKMDGEQKMFPST